jgi:hypothetical protein
MGAGAMSPMTPSTELLMERIEQELSLPADGKDIETFVQAQHALATARELIGDMNTFGREQIRVILEEKTALANDLHAIRLAEQHEKEKLLSQAPPELFGELKHENALLREELGQRTKDRNALLKKAFDPDLPGVQTNYSRRRKDMPQIKRAAESLLEVQDQIFEDSIESISRKPMEFFRERYDALIMQLQNALRAELGRQIGCDRVTELGGRAPAAMLRLAEVLYPSNKRFLQYYYKVLRSINLTEAEELAGLISDAKAIPTTGRRCQTSGDGLLLMMQAAKALKNISALLGHVEANSEAKVDAGSPKTFYRLVERAATISDVCFVDETVKETSLDSPLVLNFKYDWCCSFIRGKITASTMKEIRTALKNVLSYRDDGMIVVDYVKDRFDRPTAAGWRDLILGIHFADDGEGHIVELQFMHEAYVCTAEELGSYEAYEKGRAAVEALEMASRATRYGIMTPLISFHCNVSGREIALSKTLMCDDPWKGWGSDPEIKFWEGVLWRSNEQIDFWSTAIKFLGRFDGEAYRALCAYGMPPLRRIDMRTNRTIVNDDILSVIVEVTPTLRFVDCSGCTKITDLGVASLAKCCTRLQIVDLANCMLVTDEGINGITTHCGESLKSIELKGNKVRPLRTPRHITRRNVCDLLPFSNVSCFFFFLAGIVRLKLAFVRARLSAFEIPRLPWPEQSNR